MQNKITNMKKENSPGAGILYAASSFSAQLFMLLLVLVLASGCELLKDLDEVVDDGKNIHVKPGLELMAEGLTSPVWMEEAPDGSGNLLVAEQPGLIKIITPEGNVLEEPFLDIRDKVIDLNPDYDERGLLSFAFHPQYAKNGRFFVFYTAPLRPQAPDDWDHTNYVSEFRVTGDHMKADPNSERIILAQDHPYFNHNGGIVAFGPHDGYLYISIGDGGNRDDQGRGHVPDWYERNVGGNGQDIFQNFMGDILRVDVDGGHPYGIPADNPFVGEEGLDEIYAYGFRNPAKFSFDMKGTHALYSQDAGQEMREEINLIVKGGNYGWNVKEGTLCFDASNPENPYEHCPDEDPWGNPLLEPVIEFVNSKQPGGLGLVVVGGYVYRGKEIPQWDGKYIFGTWSTTHEVANGLVFISEPEHLGLWDFKEMEFANQPFGDLNAYLLGFGQDLEGEVYVLTAEEQWPLSESGKVYKIVASDNDEQQAGVLGNFSMASLLSYISALF
jgi:glucose/arabinose dehydrogenase